MASKKSQIQLSFASLLFFFILSLVHSKVECNQSLDDSAPEDGSPVSAAILENLCQNKQIELNRISQVRELAKELHSQGSIHPACSPYVSSILDLDYLLAYVESGKTCNLLMVDLLRQYQYKYITLNNDQASQNQDKNSQKQQVAPLQPIPVALTKFFIALGFQLNAECKIVMINNLEHDTSELISEDDYKLIVYMEENGAAFLSEDDQINDYDDVMLINQITDKVGVKKLLIKAKTNDRIQQLLGTCEKKFKPLYEKLIMPLIELSNLGYNYQGEMMARELAELRQNKLVRRWYNILLICESFSYIEIRDDSAEAHVGEENKLVNISSGNKKNKLELDQEINYNPVTRNSDELWILKQDNIERMIEHYEVGATEGSRIRNKLLRRLLERLKGELLSGRIFSSIKEIFRESEKSNEDKPNKGEVLEGLVEMMDEAVESEENELEKIDTRVSWGGKKRGKERTVPGRNLAFHAVKKVNGSRLSSRVYECLIGRFVPSRWQLFFWILGTAAVLMLLVHFVG